MIGDASTEAAGLATGDYMLKVAVTGGSGFIGRHVLRALLAESVQVTAYVRAPESLAEFEGKIAIVPADLEQAEGIWRAVSEVPDVLLHLAWEGLPNYRSLHHFEVELPRQYRFLKSAVGMGVSTLVVTGTCFEYGLQNGELGEEQPTRPMNPYAYAKDALRRQLEYLQSVRSFNLIWGRIFYLYGQGQAASSLWSQLQQAIDNGASHFPMSGGEQLRDFSPVEEVARHLVRLGLRRTDAGAVNICSGAPRSVRNMVERWIRDRNAAIEPDLGKYPYPDYEPMAFWGSRRKLAAIEGAA
jgi:nucleoside-diphosphate-sugar epimerase